MLLTPTEDADRQQASSSKIHRVINPEMNVDNGPKKGSLAVEERFSTVGIVATCRRCKVLACLRCLHGSLIPNYLWKLTATVVGGLE